MNHQSYCQFVISKGVGPCTCVEPTREEISPSLYKTLEAMSESLDPIAYLWRKRCETLQAAANEVLRVYMPQFNDSRAVDDCLVRLAAAVANIPEPQRVRAEPVSTEVVRGS